METRLLKTTDKQLVQRMLNDFIKEIVAEGRAN